MSAVPVTTSLPAFTSTLGLYCPACEEPFAPSPTGRTPLLLSPCGHSLCRACVDALVPPVACLVCDAKVDKHTENLELAWLAEEVVCGGSGSGRKDEVAGVVWSCALPAANSAQASETRMALASTSCTNRTSGHANCFKKRGQREVEDADAAPAKRAPPSSPCPAHPVLPCSHTQYCMAHKSMVCEACSGGKNCGAGGGGCCEVVSRVEAARRLHESAACHARRCAAASTGRYSGAIGRVEAALVRLKGHREECVERVNSEIGEILVAVEALRVRALERVEELYRERVKSFEATLDRLMVGAGQLEACVALESRCARGDCYDVAKAAELESLCAGMSRLCDAYVGVDTSPCISVKVCVDEVVSALKPGFYVNRNEVNTYNCVALGPGAGGFDVASNCSDASGAEAQKVENAVMVKVLDCFPKPVAWLTPDDVSVQVRAVSNAADDDAGSTTQPANVSVSGIAVDNGLVSFSYMVGAEWDGASVAAAETAASREVGDSSITITPSSTTATVGSNKGSSGACVDTVEMVISVCGKQLACCPLYVKRNDIVLSEWEACARLKRLDAVTACMREHKLHAGVLRLCVKEAIAILQAGRYTFRGRPTVTPDRALVEAVVAMFEVYGNSDALLAGSALQLLADVFEHTPRTMEALAENSTCVVVVMGAHRGCVDVQTQGCKVFACLVAVGPLMGTSFWSSEVLDAVFAAMDGFPGALELQEHACSFLNFASVLQPSNNKELFVDSGGFARVLAAMAAHPNSEALQDKGCRIIAQYVHAGWWWQLSDRQQATAKGVFGVVLSAIAGHASSADMQKMGCAVLEQLLEHLSPTMLSTYVKEAAPLRSRGDAPSSSAAVATASTSVCGGGVAEAHDGGTATAGGSNNNDSTNKDDGESVLPLHPVLGDVLNAVLKAMKRHRGEQAVQQAAVQALAKLITCDFPKLDMATHIVGAGGVRALSKAMKAHTGDEALCTCVTWVLSQLSQHVPACPPMGVAFADPTVAKVVVRVMKAHKTCEEVQKSGCWLVYAALTVMDSEGLDAFLQWGGVRAVITAMTLHPSSLGLQRSGHNALRKYCTRATNGPLITHNSGAPAVLLALRHTFGSQLAADEVARIVETLKLMSDAFEATRPAVSSDSDSDSDSDSGSGSESGSYSGSDVDDVDEEEEGVDDIDEAFLLHLGLELERQQQRRRGRL